MILLTEPEILPTLEIIIRRNNILMLLFFFKKCSIKAFLFTLDFIFSLTGPKNVSAADISLWSVHFVF